MGIIDAAINSATTVEVSKENRRYADRVNRQVWARDDSAIQRRVKDMKKAGINPVLAAGQAASNSPPITSMMQAPQISDPVENVMALIQQEANISQTTAQKKLIEQQEKNQFIKNQIDALELARQKNSGGNPKTVLGRLFQDLNQSDKAHAAQLKLQDKLDKKRQDALDAELQKQIKEQNKLPWYERTVK